MDFTKFVQSGYGSVFVESNEVKRAVNSITVNNNFSKVVWNAVQGIVRDPFNDAKNQEVDQLAILHEAAKMSGCILVLENYDCFLNDGILIQTFLNKYPLYKSNQTCLVMVGTDRSKIPPIIKEYLPVLEFNLPTEEEVTTIANKIGTIAKKAIESSKNIPDEIRKKVDFTVTRPVIEACKALTMEELENVLAYSARVHYRFDQPTILARKRDMLRQTGFMDYADPEPLENLGGMDVFKQFALSRREPFENPKSIKPKIKSILLVGVQGCGKSLAGKILASMFNWPLITWDVGACKGQYVGQTGANFRHGTKIIDAHGKAIVVMDEMEKAFEQTEFGGSQQSGGGAVADMIGAMLTWSQERKSEAILLATCNKLGALPPEFKRARRWDRIFFVDLPNPDEIKLIIEIKNRQWKANLPTDPEFCQRLYSDGWSGAEIEQLAIDSHYDELEVAMTQIPILSKHAAEEITKIRVEGSKYTRANNPYDETKKVVFRQKLKSRTLNFNN